MTHVLRALLVTAAVTLAGASAFAAGVTDTEILVGTHLDLSGPVAAGMPQLRNGMQMRLDEANDAGGVHGRKFKLLVEDNAFQPQQGVRAVQKLVRKDEVFAIINSFGTGPNAAGVKSAVEANVVYFAPWAASAVVQAQGGKSPLVFTTVANYDNTAAIGLSWAIKTWGAKKIGVIYQADGFGELVRKGVKTALDAHGLTPVAEASYKPGDIDFSSQVARVRAGGADLVFLATIIRETVGVMAEIKKVGWSDVRVLTAVPGRTQIVAALGKDAVEGLHGIGTWKLHYADTAPDNVKQWFASYKKRFSIDADENAMNAYSYADWFVKGVQAAGRTLTHETFSKAMQSVTQEDFMTYRRVGFKNNHLDPEVVVIDQVKGGKWTSVSPQMTEVVR
jgi:branched-chain amino acid transport system substrate-binding protein